jgi:hypothetical protein
MGPTTHQGPGLGTTEPTKLSHEEVERAIANLFQSAGFTVMREPRISGISSLPLTPDILVSRDNEVLILEVKVGQEMDIVAEDAQAIEMARRLLATRIASTSWRTLLNLSSPSKVESGLVMVGAKPSKSFRSVAAESGLQLFDVDPIMIRRALETTDAQELRSLFSQAMPALSRTQH